MQRAATSSSKNLREPSPSDKPAPLLKKPGRTPKPKTTTSVLRDKTSNMSPVEAQVKNTEEASTSRELSVPQANKEFEKLIKQKKYNDVVRLAIKMNMKQGEFLEQLCLVVKTPEQYKGFVKYLGKCKMVASFYVYGNIGVVKGAIIESVVYDDRNYYVDGGDLEAALPLALENDNHDRVIELLDVRMGITAERDEPGKREGWRTSFGWFVYYFLKNLAPCEGGMTLRRFLILRGDELKTKYPDISDTLCQELVFLLGDRLHLPKAERLLVDLIGQPLLLTPVAFAKGFLYFGDDECCSALIKYGWRETIQEGLKKGHRNGGEALWCVMQKEKPKQFRGVFPVTEEARIAVCAHLPTKKQKEDEWIKKYFTILFDQLNNLDFLPDVLWSIISEYAVLFIATMDSTFSTK